MGPMGGMAGNPRIVGDDETMPGTTGIVRMTTTTRGSRMRPMTKVPKLYLRRGWMPTVRVPMAAAAVIWISACTQSAAEDGAVERADPHVLITADSAFDADVAVRGSEAWVEWFAEDGAIVQPEVGEIRGRTDIAQAVGYLDEPDTSLRWTPLRAEIADSGDLGWTTGSYVFEAPGPDGQIARGTGVYVSIWRLQPDGWKVVMDLGNPTGAPDAGG